MTVSPVPEVLFEVPVSGDDVEFAINYSHVERDKFEHATAQQLIQFGLA
jgi:hypothetical protein